MEKQENMDRIGWLERRSVLMHIAERRRGDARVLLRNKRYDGAVYLGGYVIECMLKAAICQWIGMEVIRRWLLEVIQQRERR